MGLLIKQINHNGWDESWNVVEYFVWNDKASFEVSVIEEFVNWFIHGF